MLRVENLSKKLDHQPVIQSVSFHVPKGCFFTLLGDSGTGKTTLLKLIAGLETPDEGRVIVNSSDVTYVPADQRRIPMIFQQPLLFPHLTVFQNIAFGLEMAGWKQLEISEKVKVLMESLQISELAPRLPGTLSGGQQQRVSIARALAPGNALLLMDEPFSSLDPPLRKEMGQLVKNLQRQMKLTIIFVTHDVSEALRLSDEILLLKEGRVLETGSPDALYERPQRLETAQFMEVGNLISGRVTNRRFDCFLGRFPADELLEGPAVGVFPEHKIILNGGSITCQVMDILYLGKSRRMKVNVQGRTLWIEDQTQQALSIGQKVAVTLPEKVHLITC